MQEAWRKPGFFAFGAGEHAVAKQLRLSAILNCD
jgi:hypothetical protein